MAKAGPSSGPRRQEGADSSSVGGSHASLLSKAAACLAAAKQPSGGTSPGGAGEDLSWDPLRCVGGEAPGDAPSGPVVTLPKEWTQLVCNAAGSLGNARAAGSSAGGFSSSSIKDRAALKKLQQRREGPANEAWREGDAEREAARKDESKKQKAKESKKTKEAKKASKGAAEKTEKSSGAKATKASEPSVPLGEVEKLLQRLRSQSHGAADTERIISEAMQGLAALAASGQAAGSSAAKSKATGEDAEEEDEDAADDGENGDATDAKVKRKRRRGGQNRTAAQKASERQALSTGAKEEAVQRDATPMETPPGLAGRSQEASSSEKGTKQQQTGLQMALEKSKEAAKTGESEQQPVEGAAGSASGGSEADKEKPEQAAAKISKPLAADAPDFVPFAMMQKGAAPADLATAGLVGLPMLPVIPPAPIPTVPAKGKKGKKNKSAEAAAAAEAARHDASMMPDSVAITTMMISPVPFGHTSETFRQQLDAWGLMGTYNFFYMAPAEGQVPQYAVVNFIDATFAQLCQWLFQMYQFEGSATPCPVQGLEANIQYWNQFVDEESANAPTVIPMPTPSQWAVNGVNMMLNSKFSPQIREQFHKTKMCVFYKKGQCAMGTGCPFAHNKEELMPAPDLAKTKLCYNFFRRKCNDSKCKFAHGYPELRATNNVYKTELCRWWSFGSCKAGSACRYAHGVEELRRAMPFGPGEFDFASLGGEFDMFTMAPFAMEAAGLAGMMGVPAEAGAGKSSGGGGAKASSEAEGAPRVGRQVSQRSETQEMARQLTGTTDLNSDIHSSAHSELGAADVLGLAGGHAAASSSSPWAMLPRQMTAPAASAVLQGSPDKAPPAQDNRSDVVLRVKGTFMEAVRLDNEIVPAPVHRSWSDGDLAQLSEVMDSLEGFAEDI
eukprot:TRINITY_DN1767_c0_g2_i1.p1 TRINITY_DN1767_c0_g2~~TRINITY_DN1767_c0_g2_i1.p1  ORF type:complete len:898 (+),score=294.92 TRINITY_DN1767_c0_g2_i1:58-2751(+)